LLRFSADPCITEGLVGEQRRPLALEDREEISRCLARHEAWSGSRCSLGATRLRAIGYRRLLPKAGRSILACPGRRGGWRGGWPAMSLLDMAAGGFHLPRIPQEAIMGFVK